MDDVQNAWNNAPACVLGTVWGTASKPRLGRLGRRRACPSDRFVTAPLCAPRGCRLATACATRESLWICGQRKRVAHRPTGSKTTKASVNLIALEAQQSNLGTLQSRQPRHVNTALRHLYADPDSRSHVTRASMRFVPIK